MIYLLLVKLWNYIRGYVIIIVEGYFLEKFMNICTHRQIYLWDVERQKNSRMMLKVSIRGFKLLRPVARKTRCRVRIVRKKGLPFIFNRYKKRKAFVAGAVLFIFAIYLLTMFIWAIEITGNNSVSTAAILENLAEKGVKTGVLKYGVNAEDAINNLMLSIKELGWASIEIKGTKVKVQVVERVLPPELVPKNEPCNIVAKRDGVIKSIIVNDGIEAVKVGDTVTKGQLLISGTIPVKNDPEKNRIVHSMGVVTARTWYEAESPVLYKEIERTRTGKTANGYSLYVLGKKLHIYSAGVSFYDYDKIETIKHLSIGKDMILPFGMIIDKYYETQTSERELDETTARQRAVDEALKIAKKAIPDAAEIIKTDAYFYQGQSGLTVKITVECIEDIGETQRIGGE